MELVQAIYALPDHGERDGIHVRLVGLLDPVSTGITPPYRNALPAIAIPPLGYSFLEVKDPLQEHYPWLHISLDTHTITGETRRKWYSAPSGRPYYRTTRHQTMGYWPHYVRPKNDMVTQGRRLYVKWLPGASPP